MFDIGFSELLVIGVVSLIVVGPKDLPGMFRTVGRYVGKAKGMAREFQRSMEDAADATGLKDVTKDFKDMASGLDDIKDIGNMAKPGVSGAKAAKKNFDKIVKAKEAGIPIDDDSEAADDLAAVAADLVDDDPAPIVEIVEDETPVEEVKPKAKTVKPKTKATKPKAKAVKTKANAAKPKAKAKSKPKAKAESPQT